MLKSACLISAAALVLILLSGCVTAVGSILSAGASGVGAYFDYKASKASEPVIVVPEIDQYRDYGDLRNRIRAAADK